MEVKKNSNFLKNLWHSDKAVSYFFLAALSFAVSYTAFRIVYIQGKYFAAAAVLIAFGALCFALSALIIKKCGGLHAFAEILRNQKMIFLSVIFASLVMLFAYIVYQIFPFGDYTVLKMDLYHQYGPLFAELYDRVAEHKSLLYSWNSAGGSGFLGNFYNYLSSPVTLIMFWFKRINVVTVAISYIVLLKCILSAGSFAYYLKKHFKTISNTIIPFSLLYAFSAYFIAYYWNLMWLDAVVLFPIVLLGIEKIIDSGKWKTYFFSLILVFLSNYYMAYMVCIFSIIYFFIYYLSNYAFGDLYVPKSRDLPKFSHIRQSRLLCSGLKFFFVSVGAALVCAFALIPIYITLKNSSATSSPFPADFEKYFDILDFLSAHLAALEPTIRSSGGDVTPNIYCGIISIMLFPLYLMSKRIGWKEKVMNVLLLLFLFACFNTNYANFIWHGFHFPNDLPYRFSFMYSFIVIIMAFKTFRYIRDYNYKTLIGIGGAMIFMCVVAEKYELRYVSEYTLYASIIFIIAYTLIICATISKKLSKAMAGIVLSCAVVSEIFVCDIPHLGFSVDRTGYISDYTSYRNAISDIEKSDTSKYRTELNNIPTELRMSPCWYNFEGISCFSSMANENNALMQFRLGNFSNKINSFMYHNQTPVYNMMFNIKYLIDNDDQITLNNQFYDTIKKTDKKLTTYKNKYSSALGFAVSRSLLKNWDVENEINPFDNQNSFIKYATGSDKDVFIQVPIETNGTKNCNVTESDSTDGSVAFNVLDSGSDASLDMTFTAPKSGNYYIYTGSRQIEEMSISTGKYLKTQPIDTEPYVMDLGEMKQGSKVNLSSKISEDIKNGSCYFWVYYIDTDAFEKAYNKLCDSGIYNVTQHTDTYIKGTVNMGNDEILYTSISYDSGWKAYVDGTEVKTYALDDALICLETGKGEHTVEFKYTPQGLKTGIIISALTVGIILLVWIFKRLIIYFIRKKLDELLP